jgi:hypothetical protein
MAEASVVKIAASEVKDGWPIRVYRKTEQHGWQRMKPTNSQGRTVVIRASPRSGCIVLPRIQVRIRLLTSTKEGSKENDAVVVRRRNALLVSSRTRVRSLVFKFSDVQSCLDFSDRLVELNPSLFRIPRSPSNLNSVFANGTVEGPNLSAAESQQVLSLVGRLLCDEDFKELCHNLESSIRASEDGMQMLATLIGVSSAQLPPEATNA